MPPKSVKDERAQQLRKDLIFTEHMMSHEDVLKKYGITLEQGLSEEQVLQQRAIHGENRIKPPKKKTEIQKFLEQFKNFFALLLLAGGFLCFIAYAIDQSDASYLYLGVVLFVVVFLTSFFAYYQEAKSDKIMEGFKKMMPSSSTVVRGGNKSLVDAAELVPGDVVYLNEGDKVSADMVMLKTSEMKVDNASLTGESEEQKRTASQVMNEDGTFKHVVPLEAENLCFYTTLCVGGNGVGVVIGTAENTQVGQIAGLTTTTSDNKTPIAIEIEKFIHLISAVAMLLGVSFFIISMVIGLPVIKNVVFFIGIVVANVPEGLLATVTVSLSLTALRMSKKMVLVKHLESVETLGSTTVIASDKTGTLTQNRMTVQHAWMDGTVYATPAAKNWPDGDKLFAAGKSWAGETYFDRKAPSFAKLGLVTQLCNNVTFELKEHQDRNDATIMHPFIPDLAAACKEPDFNLLNRTTNGDASESGLYKFMQGIQHVPDTVAAYPKVFEIKFNSTNKWQLSIHSQPDSDKLVVVAKGAPERVITMCDGMLRDGEKQMMNPDLMKSYEDAYETLGKLGERVLGFAYAELDAKYTKDYKFEGQTIDTVNFPIQTLTFAGLLSLIDPPREGVPEAVAKCKRARIKVFMVTGDHRLTATAIALQVGIFDQHVLDAGKARVVTGDDIREWESEKDPIKKQALWDAALDHHQLVWARVSPAHKLLIVENNQRRGEVVAVTGDGVNDAPALKKGDIGIAMGIAGKEVSKAAAKMILLDDNFASIVNGVEEGRLIFDNLKKSIAYTLSSNIPEIAPFLVNMIIQIPAPLSTVLILCVDLGTDMIPAISLAYENKESDIMERAPRNSAVDRLVNRGLICFAYLQIGVIQALAGFFTYLVVLNDYGYAPYTLPWVGFQWFDSSLMCTIGTDGTPEKCGYGCADPDWGSNSDGYKYCSGGCKIPFNNDIRNVGVHGVNVTYDPFIEHTYMGFRGDECEDVCSRNCYWFNTQVVPASMEDRVSKWCVSDDEYSMFEHYCSHSQDIDPKYEFTADSLGFADEDMKVDGKKAKGNRAKVKGKTAPANAFYYWGGKPQFYPNQGYQEEALYYAQTSYFISIIIVQWADLLICKTRKLTIFEQGMTNGFMKFGLMFETLLGVVLIYTPPFNLVFGTRPLHVLHWFPGVPWSILIFLFDETRKYIIRSYPGGWADTFAYW